MRNDAYTIDRSDNCHYLRNATDKPIEINFHHYAKTVIIINHETGDVLSQMFSGNGSSEYFEQSYRQLKEDLYFKDSGEKTFFILQTSHRSPQINRYLQHLTEERGAKNGGEITSDISVMGEIYHKYAHGEIPSNFVIDLKNPTAIKSSFYDEKGKEYNVGELTQNVLTSVGNRISGVCNMEQEIKEYFHYSSLANLIAWADKTRLKELMEEKPDVNLNRLFDLKTDTDNAIFKRVRHDPVFSSDYLYKKTDYQNNIQDTLDYIRENGVETPNLAALVNVAANKIWRNVYVYTGLEEKVPSHLAEMGNNLIGFAIDIVEKEPNSEKQQNAVEIMSRNIAVLNYHLNLGTKRLQGIKEITDYVNQQFMPNYNGPKFITR